MRWFAAPQRWKQAFSRRTLILLYHRVLDLDSDPQLLAVTPQHFAEHLEVLAKSCRVRPLLEVASEDPPVRRGRTVVITFDDGYADNLQVALPILEKAGCCATVFVTAGKIDDSREFWWDDLERLLLQPSELPAQLTLRIAGQQHAWNLGQHSAAPSDPSWNVCVPQPRSQRQTVYLEVATLLRGCDNAQRSELLDELACWAGATREARPSHRALTGEQLIQLASSGAVEVGAHTVSHSSLTALSPPCRQAEIAGSKDILERILGTEVRSFSYPFGGRDHYDSETIRMVREAGYDCACANIPGLVKFGTDRYQLPRFIVRDWSGDRFRDQLESWFAH